jgi:hypothetical protein
VTAGLPGSGLSVTKLVSKRATKTAAPDDTGRRLLDKALRGE